MQRQMEQWRCVKRSGAWPRQMCCCLGFAFKRSHPPQPLAQEAQRGCMKRHLESIQSSRCKGMGAVEDGGATLALAPANFDRRCALTSLLARFLLVASLLLLSPKTLLLAQCLVSCACGLLGLCLPHHWHAPPHTRSIFEVGARLAAFWCGRHRHDAA